MVDRIVRLVAAMRSDGVTDPLGTPVTLAAALVDQFTLASADVPVTIAERVG